MIDWQTFVVALIVLVALVYIARRGLVRLQSMKANGNDANCETGCGKCGPGPANVKTAKSFAQIERMRTRSK